MRVLEIACLVGIASLQATQALSRDYCDSEVRTVTPGDVPGSTPPSDAIVLFNGTDLSQWKGRDGRASWDVTNGVLTVKKGSGDIETKQWFHDFQLHIEWRIPQDIAGEGQFRGNSGVFLQGRYEIQVLDSYQNRTYANGQAGAIYGQTAPLVNAMRKPGEWNVYEVIYTAPRFNDDGSLFAAARVTVLQNGVLIQNNAEIYGDTGPLGRPGYYDSQGRGPVRLQDHPDPSEPISYRNIWVRELGSAVPKAATNSELPNVAAELNIASRVPVGELLDDPATHEVLSRCLPEVAPNPVLVAAVNRRTLVQLKPLVVGLTDERLKVIEAELARARKRPDTKESQ